MPSPNFLPFSTLTWYSNCTQLLAVSWTRTNLSRLHAPAWISGGPSVTPPEHTRQYLETSRLSGLRGCYWHVDSTVSATKNSSAPNVKGSRIQKPCPAPFLLLCGRNCLLFTVSILHFHFLLIIKPPKFSWAAFSSFPCKCRPVCS